MRYDLNEMGVKLENKWFAIYCNENDQMGGNSDDGDFVEGWSIVDDSRYVQTLEDVCGLLILGYNRYALNTVEEWINDWGADEKIHGFTHAEIKEELLKKYYEEV